MLKLIKDIRLFELDEPNIDGNPTPYYMGKIYHYDAMDCLDVIQRLLFLLRHRGFGFDGFDHLYVNFTPCIPHGEVRDVSRYTIREFSWYHYVDTGCDPALFSRMSSEEQTAFVLDAVRKAALLKASDSQCKLFPIPATRFCKRATRFCFHTNARKTTGTSWKSSPGSMTNWTFFRWSGLPITPGA